jgi:hypothetical protein
VRYSGAPSAIWDAASPDPCALEAAASPHGCGGPASAIAIPGMDEMHPIPMTDKSTPQTSAAEQHPGMWNPMVVIEGQDGSGVPGSVSRQEAAPPSRPAPANIPSEAPQPPSGRQHAASDTTAPADGGLHIVGPHWTDIPPPDASAFSSTIGGNLPSPKAPPSAIAVPSGVVASIAAASLADDELLEPPHAALQSQRIAAPRARIPLMPAPKND